MDNFLIRALAHRIAFLADGGTVVSASWDNTLKVWDARSGECLATLLVDGTLSDCVWYPDAQRIVAVGAKGVYFLRFVRR